MSLCVCGLWGGRSRDLGGVCSLVGAHVWVGVMGVSRKWGGSLGAIV